MRVPLASRQCRGEHWRDASGTPRLCDREDSEPNPIDQATVLYDIYRGARRVVACSRRATGLGIVPGMSLSEATALAEAAATTLSPEPSDPAADRQALEKLAQACQQFSPVVGLEESGCPECLLLDITGLAHLFRGERFLAEEVYRALARRGLSVRIGVADTVGAAWAVAHFGEEGATAGLSSSVPYALLDKPAVAPITRVPLASRQCLPQHWRDASGTRSGIHPGLKNVPPLVIDGRRCGAVAPITILPPHETLPALCPMPIEALRLPGGTVELLHQLGVYRIGQLAALPRAEFNARFGPELLRRWDQALGQLAEPIRAEPFPSELQAEQLLEHPTTRRETIEFLLQQLIGRVAEMLFRSGRGATQLECRLHCDKTDLDLSVGTFQPTDSPQHLFQLVQMRLERISLPAPISAVSVRAATTAVVQRQQQELFCDRRDAQRPRFLAALVDRLSSRLGRRAVLRPRLVADAQPELAYHYDPLVEEKPGQRGRRRGSVGSAGSVMLKHNLRQGATAGLSSSVPCSLLGKPAVAPNLDLPSRPLRLLTRPISLAAVSILPDGPPVQFHWEGRDHRITGRWGPERIQTGWWRGQAVGRDYYRIETTAGRRYWLFRRLRDGRWFLQGSFE